VILKLRPSANEARSEVTGLPNYGMHTGDGSIAKFRRGGFGTVRSLADHRNQSVQRSTVSGPSNRDGSSLVFAVPAGVRTRV